MVKGCQRSMVVLRGTGSALFDEAYFILKPEKSHVPEGLMIDEANRIIAENVHLPRPGRTRRGSRMPVVYFLLGFLSGGLPSALLWLLFG